VRFSYILAIDTSCDDSAVAILKEDGQIAADIVYSQNEIHAPYGGVVPEISSRTHVSRIAHAVQEAFLQANLKPLDIKAVAVTFGPGLIGSLLVGVQFAKGFAQGLSVPIIAIHHIEGHLMSACGDASFPAPPFISLIASGGHSAIYRCDEKYQFKTLGETRDDAAGEAFDKIGRMLGFTYPAGKTIDKLSALGDDNVYQFPVALRSKATLDYSFSGLKNFARLLIQTLLIEHGEIKGKVLSDFCAGLQKAIATALLNKAFMACRTQNIRHLVLGGGVSANSFLRSESIRRGMLEKIQVHLPPVNHCVDNAVMIARAAMRRLKEGQRDTLDFNVSANISVDTVIDQPPNQ
jgi:N6-L-threonylcarbamoyladenine synthase